MSAPLQDAQRQQLGQLLHERLAALEASIAAARDGLSERDYASTELDQGPHDLPLRAGAFEVEVGIADIEEPRRLALLDALRRLPGPDYGRCVACGIAIPFERLVAEPEATRCRPCQAALEGRN